MDKPGYTEGSWTTDCTGRIYVYDPDKDSDVVIGKMYAASDAQLATAAPDLVEALRALVADREEVAKYSWKTWMGGEWHWNDEIWERNDPDEFKLIKAARAALSKALGEGQEDND